MKRGSEMTIPVSRDVTYASESRKVLLHHLHQFQDQLQQRPFRQFLANNHLYVRLHPHKQAPNLWRLHCKDASLIPKAVINEFPNSQFSDQESSIQRSNDSYIEVRMSRE